MVTDIEINKSTGDSEQVEITYRGEPGAVIHAMVNGLPREALVEVQDALERELAKRAGVTTTPTTEG